MKPVSEPSARLDALAASVVDAAFEVHRTLGAGYLESVYQAAMCVELRRRAIPFEAQFRIDTFYKGELVGEHRFDLLIDGDLVVELKAVEALAPIHLAQVLSYLKAGCFELGLLINFNVPLLKNGIRRVIWTA